MRQKRIKSVSLHFSLPSWIRAYPQVYSRSPIVRALRIATPHLRRTPRLARLRRWRRRNVGGRDCGSSRRTSARPPCEEGGSQPDVRLQARARPQSGLPADSVRAPSPLPGLAKPMDGARDWALCLAAEVDTYRGFAHHPALRPASLRAVDCCQRHRLAPDDNLGARSSAVEHLTFNQRVVGSIPTGLTKENNSLALKSSVRIENVRLFRKSDVRLSCRSRPCSGHASAACRRSPAQNRGPRR